MWGLIQKRWPKEEKLSSKPAANLASPFFIPRPYDTDMIVLFVAVVNVGKFFFLAVNPYFNQVVFSRSLTAWILPLKKKKKSAYSNQVKILSIQSSFLWQLLTLASFFSLFAGIPYVNQVGFSRSLRVNNIEKRPFILWPSQIIVDTTVLFV